jgi:OmpA-OmpF porin, OOP family
MTRKFLFFVFTISLSFMANAQTKKNMAGPTRPQHKWEAGVGLGHLMANSDLKFKPGFGLTLHLRRAVDHMFSLRGTLLLGSMAFDDDKDRASYAKQFTNLSPSTTRWEADGKSSYISGSAEGLFSLNNFEFVRLNKKWDPYVGAGVGLAVYKPKFDVAAELNDGVLQNFNPFARIIFGLSYKISPKMNISFEQSGDLLFGRGADLVDGVHYLNATDRTPNNDVPLYSNIRLNFNIGKKDAAEPLYWTNPKRYCGVKGTP